MLFYAYRLSDGQFVRGYPNTPPYDPATEGVQAYPEHLRPNMRTERYDSTTETKKRAATAQEIIDYDAARQTIEEQMRFDNEKLVKALAIWTAGKLGVQLQQAKQEILAIYRGLS